MSFKSTSVSSETLMSLFQQFGGHYKMLDLPGRRCLYYHYFSPVTNLQTLKLTKVAIEQSEVKWASFLNEIRQCTSS